MDMRRRGLGRGLGALIPGSPPAAAPAGGDQPAQVPIGLITPNPFQPREQFDETALNELAASIRERGLLQPLLVRKVPGGYQLVAGERRFRAAQRAGAAHVPIVVREATDREALELALIENVQREDLNPIEEARAYQRLADEFDLSQEDIAARVGKTRSAVANTIRLLHLPADVLAQVESGALSAGHARSLLALEGAAEQRAAAGEIVGGHLSVRDAERMVRERGAHPAEADLEQRAVEAALARALGTRVRLQPRRNGAGRIVIEYFSLDELNGLIERLGIH